MRHPHATRELPLTTLVETDSLHSYSYCYLIINVPEEAEDHCEALLT